MLVVAPMISGSLASLPPTRFSPFFDRRIAEVILTVMIASGSIRFVPLWVAIPLAELPTSLFNEVKR